MHGKSNNLRLRFKDHFDDYSQSINNPKIPPIASSPAPKPFEDMTKRSKRKQRKIRRQLAASAALANSAMGSPIHDGDGTPAPVILQYGEDDPIGFRTIADGYIPIELFTLFHKLPLEMRRQVWHNDLPAAQSIYISSNGHSQDIVSKNTVKTIWIHRAQASYKVPHLLSVCEESRQEVMIYNRPSFAANFGGIPVYYNPKIDLLHFDTPDALLHFYGGSSPNYLPHRLTGGYRLNMTEFHTFVSQIAVGKAMASEGMLGAMFNQMKGLKVVLVEDRILRLGGSTYMREYCHGTTELDMGWEEYTVRRKIEDRVHLKLAPPDEFKKIVQGWNGRIITEEEEATLKAEAANAKMERELAAAKENKYQESIANPPVPLASRAKRNHEDVQ